MVSAKPSTAAKSYWARSSKHSLRARPYSWDAMKVRSITPAIAASANGRPASPSKNLDALALAANPEEDAPANTETEKVFFKKPGHALAGAALGAAVTGLALSHTLGGTAAIVGGAIGAAMGAWAGDNSTRLAYDARALGRYLGRRSQDSLLKLRYSERRGALEPFRLEQRRSNDPRLDTHKKFDGYDSSRDITGVFAEEGGAEQPYRLGLELAHLRPNAQKIALHTEFKLGFPKGEVELQVRDDNRVYAGQQRLGDEQVKAKHSVRYNQVILELDKEVLRAAGWSDGEPLTLEVTTRKSAEAEVFDQIESSSVSTPGEKFFRWEGKTIYQIMTDRFANGDKSNDQGSDPSDPKRFHGGDWQGVIDKLDYLEGLDVDCIWLSCPYENGRNFFGQDGYHGYWPQDFSKPEPSFGDTEKLKELVAKAHQRGMKVILDVVVNHVGYDHPIVKDPKFRDWFHREGPRSPYSQYGLEHGSLAGLPDLAQENPEVSRYLIDAHQAWLEETNVDGYRVDAIRHTPPEFLREFDSAMKEKKEGFLTLGEVFWNDPHYLAGYQNETQDSLFDFPLMQALRDVFGGDPERTLEDRWDQFQQTKAHNFGQALTDLFSGGDASMKEFSEVFDSDHVYDNPRMLSTILDNHDSGRFLTWAGGDKTKLKLAAAFLFACRGTPSIFYGTETGLDGQLGQDRHDMDFKGHPDLQEHFRTLIKVRKNSQPLQLGTQKELLAERDAYVFSRVLPGHEVICAFNKSEEPALLEVPVEETQLSEDARLQNLLGGPGAGVRDGRLHLEVPPKSFLLLDWQAKPGH